MLEHASICVYLGFVSLIGIKLIIVFFLIEIQNFRISYISQKRRRDDDDEDMEFLPSLLAQCPA